MTLPCGVWLGASRALSRDVLVDEPYPHICGVDVAGRAPGAQMRLWRRDCAACCAESHAAAAVPVPRRTTREAG